MEIVLHTAPPVKPRPTTLGPAPYRHVVGVSIGDTTLWRPDVKEYPKPREELLDEPYAGFGIGLRTLMAIYIIPRVSGRMHDVPPYNCHLAAGLITGKFPLDPECDYRQDGNALVQAAYEAAYDIVREGRSTDANLPLGVQGVIGRLATNFAKGSHSFVGLGEGREEVLEVDRAQGDLGIQRYDRNWNYYQTNCGANGLYVAAGA